MASVTQEIKRCDNPCPLCNGQTYLLVDVAASGRWERMYIRCLKCGPIQTLSSISSDDARKANEETLKRAANQ